jgi:hypothetical protein
MVSFREAEEASNAQGTVQAALDWALQNAKNNPTPKNIAIAKDTFAARQATIAANAVDYSQVAKGAAADITDINKTIAGINTNIADVNTAGAEAGKVAASMGGTPFVPIGDVVTPVSTGSKIDPLVQLQLDAQNAARVDAFKLLQDTFTAYGLIDSKLGTSDPFLQTLMNLMKGYTDPATGKVTQVGPEEATLLLKQTDAYKNRFAGNQTRVANGLNALTEAEYLALENQYSNLMRQYGVGESSANNLANKAQFANLIGSDISAAELNTRLDLAVMQVQNADPTVMATLKQFYPSITQSGLVGYFLAPEETLPQLQRQVQTADIGAAAIQQGLTTDKTGAEALAAYGVTYGQAQAGYGKIAEVLPASQKLSNIYGAQTGINYNQAEGESEFLKNSGAAALERQKLKDLEISQFSGRSGVLGANVAAGYSGSLGKSIQGAF